MPALPPFIADVAEAEAFLAAHPEIVQFEAFVTDPSGVQRGKILRRPELLGAYRNGRPLPCSILSLDIRGADVEETGLVWEEGDSDRVCRPVVGTLVPVPWRDSPTAQLILTSFERDGTPTEADPRHALARVVDACKARGLHPVTAVELEFYLLDGDAAAALKAEPPTAPNGCRQADLQAYLMQDLADFAPFLDDVYAAAEATGLPARTLISEYSPGQLEIVLEHRTDALRACDDAILWKRLVKAVAERHGYAATFMAKPYADRAGSGMHLHVSFADEAGRNLFAGDEPEGNALLRSAIAGPGGDDGRGHGAVRAERQQLPPLPGELLRAGRPGVGDRQPLGADPRHRRPAGHPATSSTASAAPTPIPTWRSPPCSPACWRASRRASRRPPRSPATAMPQIPPSLPRHWPEALARARRSEVLPRRMGARFHDVFLTVKEAECDPLLRRGERPRLRVVPAARVRRAWRRGRWAAARSVRLHRHVATSAALRATR
jgi:glutamine synthetase